MADEAAEPRKRRPKQDGDGGGGGGAPLVNVFELMSNTLEKLKILNYETEFCAKKDYPPFTRTYFALPSNNSGTQFTCFVTLISWLMKLCDREFAIDKYDDPNASVDKILIALRNMGFQLDFPANKLKAANGEAVCAVLNFVTDFALKTRGFRYVEGFKTSGSRGAKEEEGCARKKKKNSSST